MKIKFSLFVLFLTLSCPLIAQNKYDLSQFASESGRFFTQPARWGGTDLLRLGVVTAATIETRQYDATIQDSAQEHRHYAERLPVQVGEQWGGFLVSPLLGIGLLTYGSSAGNIPVKKTGFEITQSLIYASVITEVMKNVIGRARPHAKKGPGAARMFTFNKYNDSSFPAGHVDAAVSLSTVLSRDTDSAVLKILAYVPAALTVASRIYTNQHWASDCVFGAAIGYYSADWVMNEHEKKAGGATSGLSVQPYFAGDTVGLGLSVAM